MKKEKKPALLYRILKPILMWIYPNFQAQGVENLPQEPAIIVGNHSQMHGPLCCEFHFPGERYTWCAGQMMHLKEVPAYAFQDFWSQKPKYTHWFYKLLSYLIAPLAVLVFNNARTIGVYRDTRIISTFKTTVKRLQEGNHVVIFPEHDVKHNHIIYDFQDKFIDIARLYYKMTGKELAFVPMYIAPRMRKMYLGEPIRFRADVPMEQQREQIRTYLMDRITRIACALPEHTVVPYRNIPKRDYPSNKQAKEVEVYEKTGG